MQTIDSLETQLSPLLPGLIGIHLSEAGKDRVVATMSGSRRSVHHWRSPSRRSDDGVR